MAAVAARISVVAARMAAVAARIGGAVAAGIGAVAARIADVAAYVLRNRWPDSCVTAGLCIRVHEVWIEVYLAMN